MALNCFEMESKLCPVSYYALNELDPASLSDLPSVAHIITNTLATLLPQHASGSLHLLFLFLEALVLECFAHLSPQPS